MDMGECDMVSGESWRYIQYNTNVCMCVFFIWDVGTECKAY